MCFHSFIIDSVNCAFVATGDLHVKYSDDCFYQWDHTTLSPLVTLTFQVYTFHHDPNDGFQYQIYQTKN